MTLLPDLIALVGGIVHTLVPGSAPAPATVVFDGPMIVSVGDEEPPAGAEIIDISGLHVIPGLIDGMMNFDAEHDALYVAAGVTTVRDVGNELGVLLEAQTPALRDRIPGPSLLTCGRVLDGSKGVSVEALVLESANAVPTKLGALLEIVGESGHKLDFLSLLDTIPAAVYPATLAFGQERGLPVWGPLPREIPLESALEQGQAGFFGLGVLLPPGSHWGNVDPAALDPRVELFAQGSSAMVPMLGVYARILAERDEQLSDLQFLAPTYESQWRQQLGAWESSLNDSARRDLNRALDLQRDLVLELSRAGVTLVPGSSAPNPWRMPGASLIDELEELAAAGLAPAEVLRLATAGAASALGQESVCGSLAPGMRADMVVLASDPRDSVAALREPEIVVVRGQALERPELVKRVRDMRSLQDAVRAEASAPLDVPAPEVPEGDLVLSGRAELWALNLRHSSEHFKVVRQPDGTLCYCTRIRYPATANSIASEMRVQQVIQDGLLVTFQVQLLARGLGWDAPEPLTVETGTPEEVTASERSVTVRGAQIGASKVMNVERRLNGMFLDNKPSPDPLAALDVSLVLNAMITAKHFPEGLSYAISLEGNGLAGASDRWNLSVREQDRLLQVNTSRGALAFGMDAKGQPLFAARQRGTDQIELRVLEFDAHGGPGLALPASRVFVPPTAQDAENDR